MELLGQEVVFMILVLVGYYLQHLREHFCGSVLEETSTVLQMAVKLFLKYLAGLNPPYHQLHSGDLQKQTEY